jgi:hypothetical protein
MQKVSETVKDKKSASEKLIAFTEFYRTNWKKMFEKGGCPIQNASIEADDNLSFLKKPIQNSIKNWVQYIASIIEEGQKTGEFKKSVIPSEYAYTIVSVLEGGIMLSKIMNNQQLLFAALDRIISIIKIEIKK